MNLQNRREHKLPSHCLDLAIGPSGQLFAACFDGGIYTHDPAKDEYAKVNQHDNVIFDWEVGDKAGTDAAFEQADVVWAQRPKLRLVQRSDGAWKGVGVPSDDP